MSRKEARDWLSESLSGYADELAKTRSLDSGEAAAKARETLERILPEGETTPGHSFSWVIDEHSRVGKLWWGPSPTDPKVLYIYDISIDQQHQGRGFGGEVLDLLTDLARGKGLSAVELSVFEDNADARRLYEGKGFVAVNENRGQIGMRLDINETE